MGRDPRKRFRSAAQKKARRDHRKHGHAQDAGEPFMGVGKAAVGRLPIHECLMSDRLFEMGIGHVVIARQLPSGELAVGYFMVDARCMGIKGAAIGLESIGSYKEHLGPLSQPCELRQVEPAFARKLVEKALEYAANLGFEPDDDYWDASAVLGDIDPDECAEEFVFGKDGKPFYVSGPYDSEEERALILARLQERCGEGGYHFSVVVGENPPPDFFEGDVTIETRSLNADANPPSKL